MDTSFVMRLRISLQTLAHAQLSILNMKTILLTAKKGKEETEKLELHYPEEESKTPFEKGILLIVDTSSFGMFKTKIVDDKNSNDPNPKTLKLSTLKGNALRILLHNSKEIPMFYDRKVENILLKNVHDAEAESVKSYKILVHADKKKLSKDLESKPIDQRKCTLQTELSGLKWFSIYSETNCLFECKAKLAEETCKCLPFWMTNYFHETDLHELTICNIQVS